jgi:hypothetical protein
MGAIEGLKSRKEIFFFWKKTIGILTKVSISGPVADPSLMMESISAEKGTRRGREVNIHPLICFVCFENRCQSY